MDERSPGSNRTTWLLAGVALVLFVPLALAVTCSGQPYFEMDLAVANAFQSVHAPGLETLMHGVSMADNNVAGPSVMLAVVCAILACLRQWREAVVFLVAALTGQLLWVACGKLVNRPRPDPQVIHVLIEEANIHGFPSFPSGHTVFYTVFFGFLWFLAWTKVKAAWLRWPLLCVLAAPILLVGFARIYLGAHWASDIVGGYLLGGAVLAGGIAVSRRWQVH